MEGEERIRGLPTGARFTLLRRLPSDFVLTLSMPDGSITTRASVSGDSWLAGTDGVANRITGFAAQASALYGRLGTLMIDTSGWAALSTVGTVTFDNQVCYEVRRGAKSTGYMSLYFATESGLLVGYRRFAPSGTVAPTAEAVFGDYYDFGHGKVARRTVNKPGDRETVFTIEKVSYDTVDSIAFALPAQLRRRTPF